MTHDNTTALDLDSLLEMPVAKLREEYPEMQQCWEAGLSCLQPSALELETGLRLHAESLAIDAFGFLPLCCGPQDAEFMASLAESFRGPADRNFRFRTLVETGSARSAGAAREFVAALRVSGLDGMVQTVAEGKSREQDVMRMACSIDNCRRMSPYMMEAGHPEEFHVAHDLGRFAVTRSVNGPPCPWKLIDPEMEFDWLPTWHRLGVRLMHLTYNRANPVGSGCAETRDGGLTALGHELVKALNETGIVVDVPHSSRQTLLDAARASSKPILISHSSCKAVYNHIRGKSDEEIKAVAATGGAMGIVVLGRFLGEKANLNTFLDHLEHALKVVGEDHVMIGTDRCYRSSADRVEWPKSSKGRFSNRWWGNWTPENNGPDHSSDQDQLGLSWINWPLFTVGMVQRGFSENTIRKILGQNLLRVLEANRPEREVRVVSGN